MWENGMKYLEKLFSDVPKYEVNVFKRSHAILVLGGDFSK